MKFSQIILALCIALTTNAEAQNVSAELPVVDLGYEIYRASSLNETTGYYEFNDIRYAAPPVGDLRWRIPVVSTENRTTIQENRASRSCPQAYASWQDLTIQWIPEYIANGTIPENLNLTASGRITPPGPTETEDCLFLDVVVPKKTFERAQNSSGYPVLVWIHGGGFVAGSKSFFGSPINLLQHSQNATSDGVVYVSINYRLGFLGFLGGAMLQRDGVSNVAFYDQRLALQWVQDNIHLFGGDKNQVTVMGESGGGGSIMHQITAFGGHASTLFKRAIIQSPAWFPYAPAYKQAEGLMLLLKNLNVTSLSGARNATSAQVIAANSAVAALSPYSTTNIGPTIDGIFITQDPKVLLANGMFNRSIEIMVSHTSDEGLIFAPPITNDTGYEAFLRTFWRGTSQSVLSYIATDLYPPVFDGSKNYTDQVGRTALTISESMFVCNTIALNQAKDGQTFAYLFAEPPGLHGADIGFTFYDPLQPDKRTSLVSSGAANVTVTDLIQDWVTSYAVDGIPRTSVLGGPNLEISGLGSSLMNISSSGVKPTAEAQGILDRCAFWQLALQY
ncbi:Carboxylesterase [Halenospora varia]|nr:Carboxylesterase [Halenospora varia]